MTGREFGIVWWRGTDSVLSAVSRSELGAVLAAASGYFTGGRPQVYWPLRLDYESPRRLLRMYRYRPAFPNRHRLHYKDPNDSHMSLPGPGVCDRPRHAVTCCGCAGEVHNAAASHVGAFTTPRVGTYHVRRYKPSDNLRRMIRADAAAISYVRTAANASCVGR